VAIHALVIAAQPPVLLDGHDHYRSLAVPGDHLRAVPPGSFDQLADVLPGCLKLPRHARRPDTFWTE